LFTTYNVFTLCIKIYFLFKVVAHFAALFYALKAFVELTDGALEK